MELTQPQPYLFEEQELPIPARKGSGKTWQLPNGYIYEFAPDNPAADLNGRVLQHRLVMEWLIGRFLTDAEVVHHEDGVKNNNHLDNLQLHSSNVAHLKSHGKRHDPVLVELVRKAAPDRNVAMNSIPASQTLIKKICKVHGFAWVDANSNHATEELVLETKKLHSKPNDAAKVLGISKSNMYMRWGHLFPKERKPCGFLDVHREAICKNAMTMTAREIAPLYGTSHNTIHSYLERWSAAGVLPIELAAKLNASLHRIRKL